MSEVEKSTTEPTDLGQKRKIADIETSVPTLDTKETKAPKTTRKWSLSTKKRQKNLRNIAKAFLSENGVYQIQMKSNGKRNFHLADFRKSCISLIKKEFSKPKFT